MSARAAVLALVLGGCAMAPDDPDERARSLAAAESAFAAQSVREGMRAAFLANFADEGLFVRNGWIRARPFLQGRPDPPILLDWRPVFVETAASGDFGLSTGPWKLTSRAQPGAAPAFGQFISIWKRDAGGPWRVVVDLGVDHPQPTFWETPLEAHAHAAGHAGGTVTDAEARFDAQTRAQGARSAYAAMIAPNVRLYRDGEPPAIGARAAGALIERDAREPVWVIEHAETAASRDFGYALGHYADARAPATPVGHFVRVWRLEPAGWQIALEVVRPAPK